MNRRTLLAAGVIITQLTDAASTLLTVGRNGVYEANPLMAQLLEAGPAAFVSVKAAAGVGLAAWSWKRPTSAKIFVGVFGAVTLWNLTVGYWTR